MKIRILVNPRTFHTSFIARTSRGAITQKKSYFVFLEGQGGIGIGEGAPLPGLSLDGDKEWVVFMSWVEANPEIPLPQEGHAFEWAKELSSSSGVGKASSILYALETAALSLLSGKPEVYFPSRFTSGSYPLEINGLVWMDNLPAMRKQAEEKVKAGFTTIKFKIGSFDWESEKAMLKDFRKQHSQQEITIRVDANGAYKEEQVYKVLEDLQNLYIHSIEQPIPAGKHAAMQRLIVNGATPIALDEELITPMPSDEIQDMLLYLNAPYLVLKPSLIGGLAWSQKLIELTEAQKSNWWLTSSLETPVGLTPLAQFAALYSPILPQGLSTGKIYNEQLSHPNALEGNQLYFNPSAHFDVSSLRLPDPKQEV